MQQQQQQQPVSYIPTFISVAGHCPKLPWSLIETQAHLELCSWGWPWVPELSGGQAESPQVQQQQQGVLNQASQALSPCVFPSRLPSGAQNGAHSGLGLRLAVLLLCISEFQSSRLWECLVVLLWRFVFHSFRG